MRILWQGERLDTYLTVALADPEETPEKQHIIFWRLDVFREHIEYSGTVSQFKPESLQNPDFIVTGILQNIDTVYLALEKQRKDEMVKNGYLLS